MKLTDAERERAAQVWLDATAQRERYWARYWAELPTVLADRRARGLKVHPGPYLGPVNYTETAPPDLTPSRGKR